jgi:hypothetical protein
MHTTVAASLNQATVGCLCPFIPLNQLLSKFTLEFIQGLRRLPPQETGPSFISATGGTEERSEELFTIDMAGMTAITVGHLKYSGQLTVSITGSNCANMVVVPGSP